VEHDDSLTRQVQREAQTDRRRQPHRMLQVEEVFLVAEIVELLGHSAHDRDDGLVVELRVEHRDALGSLHLLYTEGLRPPDSPTRALARRCAGSLRPRGSLAALVRFVITFLPSGRASAATRLATASFARRCRPRESDGRRLSGCGRTRTECSAPATRLR